MRDIQVSTDVFARIWSLRKDGEDSEDEILRRVLRRDSPLAGPPDLKTSPQAAGLCDQRFGVVFPEGFRIERSYRGRRFCASVQNGQWVIEGISGRFSKLNELSRVIGTKTENAWVNWFFIDGSGKRRRVSTLRDPTRISVRSKRERKAGYETMGSTMLDEKVRWCDDVRAALRDLGGKAHLGQIYRRVSEIRRAAGRSTPPSLEEVVRQELEIRSSDSEAYDADRGQDWFELPEGKGSGVWALRGD